MQLFCVIRIAKKRHFHRVKELTCVEGCTLAQFVVVFYISQLYSVYHDQDHQAYSRNDKALFSKLWE